MRVQPAGEIDLRVALEILLRAVEPQQRERQIADALRERSIAGLSLDGLLLAARAGAPVGVILFVIQPDGCGFVWPPVVATQHDGETVADALLQAVTGRLDGAGAWIGQSLLDPGRPDDEARLTRNGFARLTQLDYLQRALSPSLPEDEQRLQVVRADPTADERRLGELIERTYDRSQDCPGLTGLRTGRQAVAGHRTTGVLLPNGWFILRENGRDVGVLVLADQPDQHAWELVYMGVVPEARGRGFGEEIVRLALREAQGSNRDWLLLAVDRRNGPAQRVYQSYGFKAFDSKVVFVRPGHGRTPAG
ncbi:MAG: GNAT family N-acetyltransferase [Planctomycetaceae bacterium]